MWIIKIGAEMLMGNSPTTTTNVNMTLHIHEQGHRAVRKERD